jgi:hypothetical protein
MDETDTTKLIDLLSLHDKDSSQMTALQKMLSSNVTLSIKAHQQSCQLFSFLPSLAAKLKVRKYSKGKIIYAPGNDVIRN